MFVKSPSDRTLNVIFITGMIALMFAVNGSIGDRCINSCDGLMDGQYQKCNVCISFANCSSENLTLINCTGDQVWDDYYKACLDSSRTCDEATGNTISTTLCQSNCEEPSDIIMGQNYQSCYTCDGYIACVSSNTYYNMSCPGELVWDDGLKTCNLGSNTCESS